MTTGWQRNIYPTQRTAEAAVQRGDMFIAEAEGRLVAAGIINQQQVAEYAQASWHYEAAPEQVMVLHTLVVLPELKGRGYGARFVDFYERYALAQGCPFLRMDTNAANLPARSLYKKLGYTEAAIVSSEFNGLHNVQLVCLEKKL